MFTAIGASTGIFLAQIKLSSIFTDLFMDMIPVMEIIMPQASTGKFFYIDILLYFKRRLLHHFLKEHYTFAQLQTAYCLTAQSFLLLLSTNLSRKKP